jgi:NADPH-dependent curcumin reductase CurA
MPQTSREIQLAARPVGEPKHSDFRLAEVEVPDPGPGEALVRNRWMSVDPYMRGRMTDRPSYVPPFQLGAPLEGGAVGDVVASNAAELADGTTVLHNLGWREYAVVQARAVRPVDTSAAPEQAFLGVLGMPGLTAYVGLLDMAGLRDGDVVFVSSAAGCVGGVAGQIAKVRGHTVIGSAGSAEKIAFVTGELGFDAAFDYHGGNINAQLRAAAPDGIDVYFDNVGGEHLEAAIAAMRTHGRIALCGAISQYNATDAPPGIRNLASAVVKRLTLRGFIITDSFDRMPDFIRDVGGWLRDGKIRYRETVVEGIEHAPDAFIGLLRGENTGKMLVKLE